MENAVDALKMAFAVIVFTLALTVGITVFTQARSASDDILKSSDKTQYYEYISAGIYNDTTGEWDSVGDKRIVGLDSIIPTLYKYYKENYTVIFLQTNGEPLELYKTQTEPTLWSGSDPTNNKIASIVTKYYDGVVKPHTGITTKDKLICAFDIDDETKRHEPWTGNPIIDVKTNMDAFLNGSEFIYPNGEGKKYTYSGFVRKYSKSRFVEKLGVYNYAIDSNTQTDNKETNTHGAYDDTIKNKKKRVIVYQLVN